MIDQGLYFPVLQPTLILLGAGGQEIETSKSLRKSSPGPRKQSFWLLGLDYPLSHGLLLPGGGHLKVRRLEQ